MCFVRISEEQTAVIYLYIINTRVFITEVESVYCAVRTEYLKVNHDTLSSERGYDRLMKQDVTVH